MGPCFIFLRGAECRKWFIFSTGIDQTRCSADLCPFTSRHRPANISPMFLRAKTRAKDGKAHRYWNVVENRRVHGGRVLRRDLLYLGELNDTQHAGWVRTIAAVDGNGS